MPSDPLSTTAANSPLPDRYEFILPAWGEKYIRVFLEYSLPSHLSENNFGVMPSDTTLFRIFTRTSDISIFRSSELFRQYEANHRVRFESIDDLELVKENPYLTLTACQERALVESRNSDTAFFFVNPDGVYGDGTYRAVLRRFAEGKRAILTQGLRANLQAFAAQLDTFRSAPGVWPGLPPRRLARLVLDNLHPLSAAHVVSGSVGNRSLGSYYWRVGTDGLVCRCFHTHPLAVRPLVPITRLYTTIDHEYVRMSCPDPLSVHLVTDSDEIIAIELSDPGHLADWVTGELIPDDDVLKWMADWTNSYHRAAMRQTIVYHAEDYQKQDYAVAERDAEIFAGRMLSEFALRNPEIGQGMPIVTRAIASEEYAAAQARMIATNPAEPPAAPPPPPAPPPVKPSILGRFRLKLHRLFNRRLYDRTDDLTSAVGTLSQQRDLIDDRVRRLEANRTLLLRQMESEKAEFAQRIEAVMQSTAAAVEAGLAKARSELDQVRGTYYRLLNMLSRSSLISFSDRDPALPSSQPPLGYADYDMASLVYRPSFERAIRYLQGNDLAGCIAEFGTYRGFTAQTIAELLRDIQWKADLYLYDSFAGLPAPTGNDATSYEVTRRKSWLAGEMAPEPDIVQQIRKSVSKAIGSERLFIYPGFFDKSLPAHPPREKIAIIHMDADFYESCRFVLQFLADRDLIQDGAVLMMDDFNSNAANPNMGERKALIDFQAANPRWTASAWFTYGWHGHAFFLHDTTVGR